MTDEKRRIGENQEQTAVIGRDMTKGNVTKLLLDFLWPFLLASLLNSIYNTVDMIIIGQFAGSAGTVAVSQGGKMMNLLNHVSTGLAGGGQILISQQIGAQQRRKVNTTIGTLFSVLGISSMGIMAVCLIFTYQILGWMNTPAESFEAAKGYFIVTTCGLPFIGGYNAVCSILRGMGDSKRPLIFITIAAVLNLILDIVFIVCFDMGAVGTAWATVIGQLVAFLLALIVLYRKRVWFGFDFKMKSLVPDMGTVKTILAIGIPVASSGIMINITQLFVLRYVNVLGIAAAAAYSVGDKIINLTNVVATSIKQAGGAMAGQNIGAGRQDRAAQVVFGALKITMSVAAVFGILFLLFPQMFFRLFTSEPSVLAYAGAFMAITALTLILSAYMSSFDIITAGTGFSALEFIAGFLDGVVFRLAFSFLLGIQMDMGVTGFFLANTLSRLGPCIIHSVYFFTGAWRKRRTLIG